MKQCCNWTIVHKWNLHQCEKDGLPAGPSEEQVGTEVGPVLGKAEHECVHDHCRFGNAEDEQRLPSHNGVDYATEGS